jgi:hypothetical protein
MEGMMDNVITLIFVSPLRRTCLEDARNHVSTARKTRTADLAEHLMANEMFVVVPHRRAW